MNTYKPLGQIITENQVFTLETAKFLWHLDSYYGIVRKAKSREEEREMVAEMSGETRINGILSDEEIRKFFSFLYLEPSNNGKPFLTKEVFDKVFANGLVIPDVPLAKSIKSIVLWAVQETKLIMRFTY